MFYRKKPLEVPATLSLEDIEGDLASFSSQQNGLQIFTPNAKQVIEEIINDEKSSDEKLEISMWWKIFKLFQSQFRDMEERAEKIDEMKAVIEAEVDELKEKRELLKNEIQENYGKVLKLKTPQ